MLRQESKWNHIKSSVKNKRRQKRVEDKKETENKNNEWKTAIKLILVYLYQKLL